MGRGAGGELDGFDGLCYKGRCIEVLSYCSAKCISHMQASGNLPSAPRSNPHCAGRYRRHKALVADFPVRLLMVLPPDGSWWVVGFLGQAEMAGTYRNGCSDSVVRAGRLQMVAGRSDA